MSFVIKQIHGVILSRHLPCKGIGKSRRSNIQQRFEEKAKRMKTNHETFLIYRFKVPIAANWKGVYLQNTSKPHSHHLKIW